MFDHIIEVRSFYIFMYISLRSSCREFNRTRVIASIRLLNWRRSFYNLLRWISQTLLIWEIIIENLKRVILWILRNILLLLILVSKACIIMIIDKVSCIMIFITFLFEIILFIGTLTGISTILTLIFHFYTSIWSTCDFFRIFWRCPFITLKAILNYIVLRV